MRRLCCFTCPRHDSTDRRLSDACPTCSREYGFPLTHAPNNIKDYQVTRSLSRGFYAATYVAERGQLRTPFVLKVVSKQVYAFFGKDFEKECQVHKRIADGAEHVVHIMDMFDSLVTFGDVSIECHVAVLSYIKGEPLEDLLNEPFKLSAPAVAQIGMDLFAILEELQGKVAFHNDLHGGNILIQQNAQRSSEAIDPSLRAVAVDLGSVSDSSKSDSADDRLGDIHWIGKHLLQLVDHLLRDPDKTSDLDYRLASALEEIAHRLAPSPESTRPIPISELREEIRNSCYQVESPWREPLKLKKYNDSYNAQTLAPWYVPLLLVDPNDRWLTRMSAPGPQIITGMRGCGKTLFLRALQLHARASTREGETTERVLERLKRDRFLGLYVSASRLLDTLGHRSESIHEPYAKLFAAYALEAIRALQHLHDISRSSVRSDYPTILGKAIDDYLIGSDPGFSDTKSVHQLQHSLIRVLVSLSRGESIFSLAANPAVAFPHLAEAIQKCSSLWQGSNVLFLLDDVSTRYLHEPNIADLLSALQFQSPSCAFKITSEAQTLELALRSPGLVEIARSGRDYEVFDLGAEVYNRITKRVKSASTVDVHGKAFVEQILLQRAKYYFNHPKASPSQLLGDVSLEAIARRIAAIDLTSKEKKEAYFGITALARVCVGDIGDVISLYELILQNAGGHRWPVASEIQSDSYQEFCSRRLYDLNRRKGELKDVAITFADASYELLKQSHEQLKSMPSKRQRLRQYMSIYVRITSGDATWQYEKLRDLIDSGLFVFAGGSDTPRTKTKDSDPIQQFKLTYRKIYGLSNFIGLAESDRFELSGDQLEQWLRTPSNGKDILLRNLAREEMEIEVDPDGNGSEESELDLHAMKSEIGQLELFESGGEVGHFATSGGSDSSTELEWLDEYVPKVNELVLASMKQERFDTVIVGLGFEERTLMSARRLGAVVQADNVALIKYPEKGRSDEIQVAMNNCSKSVHVIDYGTFEKQSLPTKGKLLIDITGLAKPVLFHAVRQALKENGEVWICHTRAKLYYPLDEEISKILVAKREGDHYALLTSLAEVLTGERGGYDIQRLHSSEADISRRRVLFAFSSAKHERLLTLLDHRDYDQVEVVAPLGETARRTVARIAADLIVRSSGTGTINSLGSDDLGGTLNLMMRKYQHWYVQRGFNFDLALTGSKLQGVAAAAMSAAVKVSECLYVRPREFDKERFTKGFGDSSIYKIMLK